MNSTVHDPFLSFARAVRPMLNRIVFVGIDATRWLHRVDRERVRRPAAGSSKLAAIATVTLDRLASELAAAGLERVRRANDLDEWQLPGQGRLALSSAGAAHGAANDAIVREYAVLMTRGVALAPDLTVRVTIPAIQLALSWADHRACDVAFTESTSVEDMLEIVARHSDIVADVEALPAELRRVVAQAAGELAAHEACAWVLRRALPDARSAPGVVGRVHDRLWRIAAHGEAQVA